jgi:hypothetical protein
VAERRFIEYDSVTRRHVKVAGPAGPLVGEPGVVGPTDRPDLRDRDALDVDLPTAKVNIIIVARQSRDDVGLVLKRVEERRADEDTQVRIGRAGVDDQVRNLGLEFVESRRVATRREAGLVDDVVDTVGQISVGLLRDPGEARVALPS